VVVVGLDAVVAVVPAGLLVGAGTAVVVGALAVAVDVAGELEPAHAEATKSEMSVSTMRRTRTTAPCGSDLESLPRLPT
jgi:hypothetical protein